VTTHDKATYGVARISEAAGRPGGQVESSVPLLAGPDLEAWFDGRGKAAHIDPASPAVGGRRSPFGRAAPSAGRGSLGCAVGEPAVTDTALSLLDPRVAEGDSVRHSPEMLR
jgi:hypothetical protein